MNGAGASPGPASDPRTLAEGAQIGHYRLLHKLGEGGMGVVFAAENMLIGKRVAIKILHAVFSQDPMVATRFMNEARAVNLINHPSLVEIHELGMLPDGTRFIVMELLQGDSLRQVMRAGGRRLGAYGLALCRQVAQALQAAHDKDIVHRDLKPENVLIVGDRARRSAGLVKILDFGLAKIAGPAPDGGHMKTRTGTTLGTPTYMAPEQCLAGAVDGRTDVYSLGIILYEMTAGRAPFKAEIPLDTMLMHVREAVPPLGGAAPGVPKALCDLVHAMLDKTPASRPTMGAVAAALSVLGADDGFDRVPADLRTLMPLPASSGGQQPVNTPAPMYSPGAPVLPFAPQLSGPVVLYHSGIRQAAAPQQSGGQQAGTGAAPTQTEAPHVTVLSTAAVGQGRRRPLVIAATALVLGCGAAVIYVLAARTPVPAARQVPSARPPGPGPQLPALQAAPPAGQRGPSAQRSGVPPFRQERGPDAPELVGGKRGHHVNGHGVRPGRRVLKGRVDDDGILRVE